VTTRRAFLKTGAAGGAALVVGFRFSGDALAQEGQEKKKPNPFDAWVHVDRNGAVTLITAKSEMGQGALTALPMILAEELEVDWNGVRVEQAPTDPSIYDHGTGGSGSVAGSWLPLRQAGAAAREMLIRAAATAWNVEPATCRAEKGFIVHGPRRRRLGYGELVEAAAKLPIPDFNKVPLKNPDDFRIVGQTIARTDIPSKVDGSARFGIDVRVPGLLYAVVARCPTFGGRPARFDATKAKAVPGVRHVVEIPAVGAGAHTAGGIAVVADSTWAAMQGRKALQIDWDHGPHASESSQTLRQASETIAAQPGKVVRNEGDAAATLAGASQKVEAVYELPFQAHATMEPMNCTVDIRADRAEAWSPTQAPDWTRSAIAQVTGLPPPSINVHTTLMGGGFGRRYQADFVIEAAQVGKAVGAPVQLLWTREDDMQHDFYRPYAYHRLSGAVDAKGNAVAWHHRIVSTSIRSFWDPPDRVKPEASEIGGAVDLAYAVPNLRVEYAPVPSGVPVAWWRSVEASLNAFVVEGFIDELAAAAKADPLAFRQRLLAEPRMIKQPPDSESSLDTRRFKGVLDLAAAKAGWGSPLPAGRGRGIACAFSFDSYVAEVAEVSVDKAGLPHVHRVVCAVDCGRAVHPDGVRAQVESAVVYGLSAALKGAITIAGGRAKQSNFHDFEVMRIQEMPVVEVHLVPSTERPTGIGEPGLPPVAPAVANAIFAATGKRLRRLPISRI
jgi:isoquinoline 1-oxidoreductase beta subunit